jgi:D-3-phosphoglycerate dehydrogenase / 2-oxoglutarate reductase
MTDTLDANVPAAAPDPAPAQASADGRRPTVLVFDQLDYLGWRYDIEERILDEARVRLLVPPRSEAREALPEADVVIVHDGPFSSAEMDLLVEPAGLVCYSVGMDQVDEEAAAARGIPVRNLPHWATQVVAEHAITLLLAAVRRLPVQDRAARTDRWDHRRLMADLGIELFTLQTVGVVGAGRIGGAFAARARALGFRTVASDPARPDTGPDLPLLPIEELLAASDAVVVCASLTPSSRGLLDARAFAAMKPGAVLVNVSRGPIVVETALADALSSGRLAFAALDVRAGEPPDPASDPLRDQPNVLLTPHTAWLSAASHAAYHREAAEVSVELMRAAGRIAG